jgi:hypothetical protein
MDLSIDFIVGLPESEGFNTVWVVVDRPTKKQHFVPYTNKVDRKKLGQMYNKEVFRLHGLPDRIVSDRGLRFALEFWKQVSERL